MQHDMLTMGRSEANGDGVDVAFQRSGDLGARREREVVPCSHAAEVRAQGRTASRRARVQDAFPDNSKDNSPCPPAQDVRAPLFPRYIFLILDLGRDRWLSVQSTVGVSSLFTCDDRPVPVPEGIVETLIQNTDEANLTLFTSGLTTGQSVRILSGPFANFVGTLERLDDAGRVRVLLEMMGTAVQVALRRAAICPAA